MRIQTVPCLRDNLSYLIVDESSRTCVIIDPGEARPFLNAIESEGLTLHAIITTHHHHDHIGGLKGLPEVPVWSSARDLDRIPGAGPAGSRTLRRTFPLAEAPGGQLSWADLGALAGDRADVDVDAKNLARLSPAESVSQIRASTIRASTIRFDAVAIPGHTEGQIAIVISGSKEPLMAPHIFVGDTLFELGCGRCFEGTPEELFESLQILKSFPKDSRIYFGHEYTEKNALFWLHHAAALDHFGKPDRSTLHNPTTARSTTSQAASQGASQAGGVAVTSREIRAHLEMHRDFISRHPGIPKTAPTLETELTRNPFLQIENATDFRYWRELRNQF